MRDAESMLDQLLSAAPERHRRAARPRPAGPRRRRGGRRRSSTRSSPVTRRPASRCSTTSRSAAATPRTLLDQAIDAIRGRLVADLASRRCPTRRRGLADAADGLRRSTRTVPGSAVCGSSSSWRSSRRPATATAPGVARRHRPARGRRPPVARRELPPAGCCAAERAGEPPNPPQPGRPVAATPDATPAEPVSADPPATTPTAGAAAGPGRPARDRLPGRPSACRRAAARRARPPTATAEPSGVAAGTAAGRPRAGPRPPPSTAGPTIVAVGAARRPSRHQRMPARSRSMATS